MDATFSTAEDLTLASLPETISVDDDDTIMLGAGGLGSSVDRPNAARGEYFLRIGGAREVSELPKAGPLLVLATKPVSSTERLAGEVAGVDFEDEEGDEERGFRDGAAERFEGEEAGAP